MEGISLYHYYVQQHLVPIYLHTNPIRHAVFCSFLSNYIKQDAATTAAHIKLIIEMSQNRQPFLRIEVLSGEIHMVVRINTVV